MLREFLKKVESLSVQQISFFAWIISIPFGAKVVHFSIGFATIYPSLILGFIFFLVSIKFLFHLSKLEKSIGLILVLFLVQSILFSLIVPGKKEALFDIHSIILFNLYYLNFTLAKYSLTKQKFIYFFNNGFLFFSFFILIFGIIESLIGIHVGGQYTYRLSQGMATINYAPLFIYDNPNDYLVYSIGLSYVSFIFNKKLFENKLLVFSILVLNLFFAHIALSRFAILLLMILLFMFLWKTYISKFKLKYLAYFLIPFILLILSNKIYLGPIIITQIESLKDDKVQNSKETKKIISKIKSKEDSTFDSELHRLDSYTVRKNLMINGIKLFKSSPLIGVGPGQFRYLLHKYETKYPIDKNYSPHNYFIEMLSQYGIMGIILFAIPLFLFLLKLRKGKWNFLFTLIIFFYYLSSLMPSAFLYLDINWILFTVIVLCFSEDFISFKSLKDVRFS
jgi:teichuronic acid biosynthesis protein TuaE